MIEKIREEVDGEKQQLTASANPQNKKGSEKSIYVNTKIEFTDVNSKTSEIDSTTNTTNDQTNSADNQQDDQIYTTVPNNNNNNPETNSNTNTEEA